MNNTQLDYIQSMLEELLRRVGGPPFGGIVDTYADFPDGLHRTMHQGYQFDLRAPVSQNWQPSSLAYTFARPPSVGSDPSNAPPGYPSRSPKGYPLFYPLGGDGKPVGTARVLYGDQSFDFDESLP